MIGDLIKKYLSIMYFVMDFQKFGIVALTFVVPGCPITKRMFTHSFLVLFVIFSLLHPNIASDS